jgi:hypothetical protein
MRRMADLARVLLACIRLFNGLVAVLVPKQLTRRLGIDADESPAALYVMRMFGIRTVLIGWDLLVGKGERRAHALQQAPLIHASDTLAAYLAMLTGKVPEPTGKLIVVISAVNTALALIAKR